MKTKEVLTRAGEKRIVTVFHLEEIERNVDSLEHRLDIQHMPNACKEYIRKIIEEEDTDLQYVKVADVTTNDLKLRDALETAFDRTNHIDTSWESNKNVKVYKQNNRSTSVGDIMLVGLRRFVVDRVGFMEF